MRNSKLSIIAGAALALATLTSSTSALAEPAAIAQECAQKVMVMANGSVASLANLGDAGIETLVELRAAGVGPEVLLRVGTDIQKKLMEEANSTIGAITSMTEECTELLRRVGADELLITRLQGFTDRVNVGIREAAFFQVMRVARMLQIAA